MFARASRVRRGYHCRQVESFLARVEVSLHSQPTPMAPADIRRAGFELVRHGYDVATVDEHLDALEERVLTAQSALGGRRRRADPAHDARVLRDELDKSYRARFARVGTWRRGYDVHEVDVFIDQLTAALAGTGAVSVEDARSVSFRPHRGGYDEDAVDETLDRVVELLLVRRSAPAVRDRRQSPGIETADPAV